MSWMRLVTSRLFGKRSSENKQSKNGVLEPLLPGAAITKTKVRKTESNIVNEASYQKTFAPEAVKLQGWNKGDLILERYEVRVVKQGGMGWVYLCFDHNYKMPVAIKTLKEPKSIGISYQKLLDKFLIESEAWVRLEKHKNIVQAKGVQRIDGQPYIFMEFITSDSKNGGDLREWISRKKRLTIEESINFGIQFCHGMEHANRMFRQLGKPFVHRDIKPDNIMITHDGVLKITDFGLVKIFDQTQDDIFSASGTPAYMPPEQWSEVLETDIRSDTYSFGCVMYEMLSGKPPFQCTNSAQYRYQHEKVIPDPVNSLVEGMPEPLNRLIMQCLEKEPQNRFSDFSDIRENLSELYQDITGKKIILEAAEEMEAWENINKGVALCELGYRKEAILDYNHAMVKSPNAVYRLLPNNLAKIHGWYCPEGREDKLVINIMSSYSNYSNQTCISKILEILVSIYGLKLISIEGGFGKIDLSFYRNLPDNNTKRETADYFLKEARIQGPEYFAITTTKDIIFYGADDQDMYDRNLKAFESGLPEKEKWIAECEHLETALMLLKNYVNNDELNAFDDNITRLDGLEEQVFYIGSCLEEFSLMKSFPEFSKKLEILNLSKRLNINQANKEKESLFSYLRDTLKDSQKEGFEKIVYEFSKKEISEYQFYLYLKEVLEKNESPGFILQYPDLNLYIQQRIKHGELDIVRAFDERDSAVEAIRNVYYSSDDQKTLNRHLKHIDILKKAYDSKLRPTEKKYFQDHMDEMKGSGIVVFIREQSQRFGLTIIEDENGSIEKKQSTIFLSEKAKLVGEQLMDAGGFYTAAELRSAVLVKNCLKQMEEENEPAGILVTGGFHSEIISRYLKDKNIPHITIMPVYELSSDDDQRYKNSVMGKKTPIEEVLEGHSSKIPEKITKKEHPLKPMAMKKAYNEVTDLLGMGLLMKDGQKAMEAEHYDKAISAFEKVLAIRPDANTYLILGLAYNLKGMPEKIIENIDNAFELGLGAENFPNAHKCRGEAHFNMGNFPEAIKDFSQLLVQSPEDSSAQYNQAICYKNMGQLSQAIKGLEQALKLNSKDEKAWFQLGEIYRQLNDPKRAIDCYSETLSLNPDYIEAYKQRACSQIGLGKDELGIQDLDELLKRKPWALGYFLRGITYKKLNKIDLALQDYDKALDLDPGYCEAFIGRGDIHYDRNDFNQAISEFSKAISVKSDQAGYYLKRANAYLMLDKCMEAIQDYDQGLTLKPDSPSSYHHGRGICHAELKQWHQARDDFDRAMALKPDPGGYFNKGLACFNLNLFKETVDALSKAIDLNHKDVNCWYLRGRSYENLGLKEQAVLDFKYFLKNAGPNQTQRIEEAEKKIKALDNKA